MHSFLKACFRIIRYFYNTFLCTQRIAYINNFCDINTKTVSAVKSSKVSVLVCVRTRVVKSNKSYCLTFCSCLLCKIVHVVIELVSKLSL